MTVYPNNFDTDLQVPHIDDNITELMGLSVNALRDVVFAIEETIGLNPQGNVGDLVSRLAVSIDNDGHLNSAELSAHGLVTLPITSSMIGDHTIPEIKLVLDHTTASLYAAIQGFGSTLTNLLSDFSQLNIEFNQHLYGTAFVDGYLNRHVASHVDINDGTNNGSLIKYTGNDLRDTLYNNTGLYNDSWGIRNAKTVMDALIQINSDLILHMLSLDGYHNASFVNLNTLSYHFIPQTVTNVQEAFDFIDNAETIVLDEHRAVLHSTGIPRHHNVVSLKNDGYNVYYGPFPCTSTSFINGRDQLTFTYPGDATLDWAFKQINVGDYVRVNYGGFEAKFPIENINYIPGAGGTFEIVIDGYNIIDTNNALAIFEKANFDDNHYGILAAASANHNYYFDIGGKFAGWDTTLGYVPGSTIIVSPNCPMITGIDLCLDDLDSTHYNLYIGFYPDANPAGMSLTPTAAIKEIDVTGNLGVTPGAYTLHGIVNTVNMKLREGGYNYRMVAFEYNGQFGLAITDTIDNPGFSIIYGTSDIAQGPFTNNVVEIPSGSGKDPLGLGSTKADVASPLYSVSNTVPTKVFVGRKNKKYNINGQFIDYLAPGYGTNNQYYYDAFFVDTDNFGGALRQRGIFRINQNLSSVDMYPGCTITLHPYNVSDYTTLQNYYGRFVVEHIETYCDGYTEIWTVDCCSWNGNPLSSLPVPQRADPTSWIPMKLYFSGDSVSLRFTGAAKDYFEIYTSKDGNTFGHRRASLPLQLGSPTTIDTYKGTSSSAVQNYGWHIIDISSKLRGFIPIGGASNQRQIRFVAQNYNATDDSYEGYICQPDPGGGSPSAGPIIRTKKGEIGRYYDNTGIDYIDLSFEIDPSNPLDPVISGAKEYVDIDVFETMRTNEQYLCLASCEQLAYPHTRTQLSLWNFSDLRQFGTISEKVLTTSAINFIQSGDRWVHQNGVVNGIDFSSTGIDYFEFIGGTALVDGVIVNINNFKVFPINMWDADSGSFTISYVLCIKKDGTHELLPISTSLSSIITFTFISGATLPLRVYLIKDIITERKDLLPIYIINGTVGPGGFISTGNPIDIRKFIANNEVKNSLVLYNSSTVSGTTLPLGNFNSWTAVSNYIKQTQSLQNTILVRGTTSINETITFDNIPINIVGDPGNLVECNVTTGLNLQLSSDSSIKNVNFKRMFGDAATDPAAPYAPGCGTIGRILESTDTRGTLKNIVIENCTFTSIDNYRKSGYAHILFEKTGDYYIFLNINIKNNSFLEPSCQLDIAIVNRLGADASSGAFDITNGVILSGLTIDGNKGNAGSWMILGSDNYASIGGTKSRGLAAYNVIVQNNSIDYIWHNLSRCVLDTYNGLSFTKSSDTLPALYHEVIFRNNTFIGLINRAIDGVLLGNNTGSYKLCYISSPSTIISGNRGTTIYTSLNGDLYSPHTSAKSAGAIDINHNILTPSIYDAVSFNPNNTTIGEFPTTAGVNLIQFAIGIGGNSVFADTPKDLVNIDHNIITNDFLDYTPTFGKYLYSNTIATIIPCNINNNIIEKCISASGNGIWLNFTTASLGGGGTETLDSFINNNKIYRGSESIFSYIYITGTTRLRKIVITDNVFDSNTVNGIADLFLVKYNINYSNKFIIQRNINQTFLIDGFQHMFPSDVFFGGYVKWIRNVYSDATLHRMTPSMTVAIDTAHLANPGKEPLSQIFFVDIPNIDGAFPEAISIKVAMTNYNGAPANYGIRAYSQTTAGLDRGCDVLTAGTLFEPTEYTVTPATAARSATNPVTPAMFTTHVITLGEALFVNRYATLDSADRSMTIIVALCEPASAGFLEVGQNGGDSDNAYIKDINILYRY